MEKYAFGKKRKIIHYFDKHNLELKGMIRTIEKNIWDERE